MKRHHRLLLSGLSGILLSLPWLGLPGWISFVSFFPLLLLNDYFVRNKSEFLSISFWGHAFFAALIWNIISVWWIAIPMFTGSIFVILSNSLLMSFTLLLAHLLYRNWGNIIGNLSFISLWLSFEFLHYHWDVDFPWLNLGNAFANNIHLIQWYEFTGVLGGSLWILLINIVLFRIYLHIKADNKTRYLISGICFLLICLPIMISELIYKTYQETVAPVNISIVQTNINPYTEKFGLRDELAKANSFLQLTQQNLSNYNLIIGPETLFENKNYWNEDSLDENLFIKRFDSLLQQHPKTGLLIGATTFHKYKFHKTPPTITARLQNGFYIDQFNSALLFQNNKETQLYHKSKLVGGVEKMPFHKYLFFLNDLTFDLGGSTGSLGIQKEAEIFVTKDSLRLAPVICYESVFGEYVSSFVKKGAQILCIITNDGWWKKSMAYKHLLSYAQLRAIETRRSIARCANDGISCFINQRGDITKLIDRNKDAAIFGTINKNNRLTFYTKNGDYIGRTSSLISICILIAYLLFRLQQGIKKPH
jgi:apolipoprotein N-acyltransferase